ncbi:hypothetical protein LTR66_002964 [Elasticomyces elasticus]|nr:hypothetical protein LTR66_002964 [Elasticomyces elasticus]
MALNGYGSQLYAEELDHGQSKPARSEHITDHQQHALQIACDVKPRLSKEQHDTLEQKFQENNKPSTLTKKGYADLLGVHLDKINNWFQNRRAKVKQDQKKQQFLTMHTNSSAHFSIGSADPSPGFACPDFGAAMQTQGYTNEIHPNGLGISQAGFLGDQGLQQNFMAQPPVPDFETNQQIEFQYGGGPQKPHDSPQPQYSEVNRRTLTQAQFDALTTQNLDFSTNIDLNNTTIPPNSCATSLIDMNQVFPDDYAAGFGSNTMDDLGSTMMQPGYSNTSSLSMSNTDSFVPSNASSHDLSSVNMAWTASSSSSASFSPAIQPVDPMRIANDSPQAESKPTQPATAREQWQPGQSVPCDFYNQDWKRKASLPVHGFNLHDVSGLTDYSEQPLSWPEDAYVRRDSSASMLAHTFSHIGIQTPSVQRKHSDFATPIPATSIATRRQRPRPAALGAASLRSASYSGATPASPGAPTTNNAGLVPGQNLRRIKSSNIVNGMTGRVQKPSYGSSQRSPLSFTFPKDVVESPKFARHFSVPSPLHNTAAPVHGNMAPPTPLSPFEFPGPEPSRTNPTWHTSGHVSRQPSISEQNELSNLFEGGIDQKLHFSSPPTTPVYHPQFDAQARFRTSIFENTPPQSAPASQQYFPQTVFAPPPVTSQPQGSFNLTIPAEYPSLLIGGHSQSHPSQQFTVATTAPVVEIPVRMTPMPLVDPTTQQLIMGYPLGYQQGSSPTVQPPPPPPQLQQQPQPQPAANFHSISISHSSPGTMASASASAPERTEPEIFFHEYNPPNPVPRAAAGAATAVVPRSKVVEPTGPTKWQWLSQGPQDFKNKEKERSGNGNGNASGNGTASLSPSSPLT